MFVVDLHTLQTIHVLNFIHDILLNSCRALDGEDVARRDDTVRERCACTHGVVLLHQDLLGKADEVLTLLTRLRSDDDFAVTALHFTHGDLAVDFADDGRIAGVAGFEELGDTRQTTGDVTTLGHGTRNLHKRGTCLDCLSVFNNNVSTHGEAIGTNDNAIGIEDIACRNFRLVSRFGDNLFSQAGRFVRLRLISHAFDDVVELQNTCVLTDDDRVEWVPTCN